MKSQVTYHKVCHTSVAGLLVSHLANRCLINGQRTKRAKQSVKVWERVGRSCGCSKGIYQEDVCDQAVQESSGHGQRFDDVDGGMSCVLLSWAKALFTSARRESVVEVSGVCSGNQEMVSVSYAWAGL